MVAGPHGRVVVAAAPLPAGAVLFGLDDWADEAERRAFVDLSPGEVRGLRGARRAAFLRYAYNCAPEVVRGTFRPAAVRHPVNFIDHACDPCCGYDTDDQIVALRPLAAGQPLTMDYGTYTFSFDHDFACRCGAAACRGRVTGEDWRVLAPRLGRRFPRFWHPRLGDLA